MTSAGMFTDTVFAPLSSAMARVFVLPSLFRATLTGLSLVTVRAVFVVVSVPPVPPELAAPVDPATPGDDDADGLKATDAAATGGAILIGSRGVAVAVVPGSRRIVPVADMLMLVDADDDGKIDGLDEGDALKLSDDVTLVVADAVKDDEGVVDAPTLKLAVSLEELLREVEAVGVEETEDPSDSDALDDALGLAPKLKLALALCDADDESLPVGLTLAAPLVDTEEVGVGVPEADGEMLMLGDTEGVELSDTVPVGVTLDVGVGVTLRLADGESLEVDVPVGVAVDEGVDDGLDDGEGVMLDEADGESLEVGVPVGVTLDEDEDV